jgi:purine-binding chemotaxis protein CheW
MSEILEEMMEHEDTQKGKYLTFKLGKEVFGLEIRYVTEIIGIQPISEVPEVPEYVKGIINLRGKIIPVIDVRLKFKKPAVEYDDRTCIIVIDVLESSIGLIVDNVSEVLNISDDNIVDPPDYKTGFHNKYIKSIGRSGEDVKLILDCEKLLNDDEMETLEEIKNYS